MSRPLRLLAITMAVSAALAVAMPLPALAERVQSDLVLIREDDVVEEDLYAAGDVVSIRGVVRGDLVVAAFTEVRIDGEVEGSVLALTSRLIVNGAVGGSVRALASDVIVGGRVADDVFVGAWTTGIERDAEIGRDLLAWGNAVEVFGSVGRNVEGQMRRASIGGGVDGNVDITVDHLTVGSTATVGGDVVYVGGGDAFVSDDAEIGGSVIAERALPPNVRIRAALILVRTLVSLAVIGLGLGIVWAVPERSRDAALGVRRRPWSALAWGIGLASIPIAMALVVGLFVTLSPPATGLPLLAIFAPFVLAAFGALFVASLASPVPVGAAIGSWLAERLDRTWSVYAWFVLGALVLIVASLVPLIGGPLAALATLLGLGGWVTAGDEDER